MSANGNRCFDDVDTENGGIGGNQVRNGTNNHKNGSNGSGNFTGVVDISPKRSRAQLAAEDDDIDEWTVIDGTRY